MMWYFTGCWALGYGAGIRIHWYTPFLCRLMGEFKTDQNNGTRCYTYNRVTLLIPKINK